VNVGRGPAVNVKVAVKYTAPSLGISDANEGAGAVWASHLIQMDPMSSNKELMMPDLARDVQYRKIMLEYSDADSRKYCSVVENNTLTCTQGACSFPTESLKEMPKHTRRVLKQRREREAREQSAQKSS
jgi:hypothetical protein